MIRLLAVVAILVFACLPQASANEAEGRHGMVATVQPIATDQALKVLREGGNAVDAAVSAALMLGVVDGHNSGIGGGCFILIRQPDGKILAIDGRETAPLSAQRDMYVRDGKAIAELSRTGPLAIAVPGALAAYQQALGKAGTRKLAELLEPAAKVAEAGYPIDRVMARNIATTADDLAKFPATRRIFLKPDGQPYQQGDILVQKDLARSYRAIAREGVGWFYRGCYAQRVSSWMAKNGGILRSRDFRCYRATQREPIRSTYRGYEIIGFPPPSSGGIHVAQILNILEHFDLRKLYEEDRAEFTNVIANAMKLAFADRAHWLGDTDFVDVPRGLISQEYARQLAGKIDPKSATHVDKYGTPEDWETNLFDRHTTHIATADAQGYWVGITATINTSFGSKVVVPCTGILLNNEMDDFSSQPGAPNAFGLVGSENNSIAPGKQPLSSMSPTIVLKDGKPILTLGAAGGPKIITQVVLGIIRVIDLEWSVEKAVGEGRWHHQWLPNRLFVEGNFEESILDALRGQGHVGQRLERGGVMQAIYRSPNGIFYGVSDPRVPGKAAGF